MTLASSSASSVPALARAGTCATATSLAAAHSSCRRSSGPGQPCRAEGLSGRARAGLRNSVHLVHFTRWAASRQGQAGTIDLRSEARPAPRVGRSTRSSPLRAAHPRRGALPAAAGGPIPTSADRALSCSIEARRLDLRAAGGYLSAQYSRCSQKYRCRHVSQSTHQPSAILHVGG